MKGSHGGKKNWQQGDSSSLNTSEGGRGGEAGSIKKKAWPKDRQDTSILYRQLD